MSNEELVRRIDELESKVEDLVTQINDMKTGAAFDPQIDKAIRDITA